MVVLVHLRLCHAAFSRPSANWCNMLAISPTRNTVFSPPFPDTIHCFKSNVFIPMQINNYKNHLLIAMPSLRSEFFTKSVVYIYEHSETEGTIGFVVNQPLSATLGNVLDHLKINVKEDDIYDLPIFSGGPVGPDQGFVIHCNALSAKRGDPSVAITTTREILQTIAKGKGPKHFIVTLGYAGWEPGQIEQEIAHNDWLVAPFNAAILFETPIAERWTAAAKQLGVDLNKLTGQIGHA